MADEEQDVEATAPVTPVQTGPVTTTSTGGDTAQSTSTRPAPGELAAINEAEAAGAEATRQQNELGDAKELAQTQLADAQANEADRLRQVATDAAADHQDMLDRIEAARADHSAAEAALSKTPFHGFFEKQTTGQKLLRIAGIAFTGLSGSQPAMEALGREMDNEVKNDFEQQKVKRNDELESLKRKGANINDLYAQWEKQNAMAAVKEQKAKEAVAAKIVEIGTRAGIPLDKLQNNILVQKMWAGAEQDKARALSHFDAHNTVTRELTPKTSITEGKTAGGKGAPQGQENLQSDVDLLRAHPPSRAALDAARRAVTEHPTILQTGSGLIHGRLPDYFSGLSEEDRASAEAVLRVTPRIAQSQFNSTRAVTDKEALASVMESSIATAGEDAGSIARKQRNLLRATGRDFTAPGAPAAPGVEGGAPVPAVAKPAASAGAPRPGMVRIQGDDGRSFWVTRSEAHNMKAAPLGSR